MLIKRILVGSSLLLLEAVTATCLLGLKATKFGLYITEQSFIKAAKPLDYISHPINHMINTDIVNLSMRMPRNAMTASFVALQLMYLLLQYTGFSMLMATNIVTANVPFIVILFAKFIYSFGLVELFKSNLNTFRAHHYVLPHGIQQPLTNRVAFKTGCLKVFNILRVVLMLPVRLFNMPMIFVSRKLNNLYSNEQQSPWYANRVLTRLAQLQSEVKLGLKYEPAPVQRPESALLRRFPITPPQPTALNNTFDAAVDLALEVRDVSIIISYIEEKSGTFWWNSPATNWPQELKTQIRNSKYLPASYWSDDKVTPELKEVTRQDYDFKCGISGNIKCVPGLLTNQRMGFSYNFDLIQLFIKMQTEQEAACYPGSDISLGDSVLSFDLEVKKRLDNIREPAPVVEETKTNEPIAPTINHMEVAPEDTVVLTREQLRQKRLLALEQRQASSLIFSEMAQKDDSSAGVTGTAQRLSPNI